MFDSARPVSGLFRPLECITRGAASAPRPPKSRQTLLQAHGDNAATAVRPPMSNNISTQERYEVRAAMLARPNKLAVILYPNHPLIPSPNPVPTRSFAGSGLSELLILQSSPRK